MAPADLAFLAYDGQYPTRNVSGVSRAFRVKRCSMCREWKDHEDFQPDRGRADGRNSKCRSCAAGYQLEWSSRPGHKQKRYEHSRNQRLRDPEKSDRQKFESRCRAWGITAAIYEAMLAAQGGGCAICGKTPEEHGRMLAVDHDHACCPTTRSCCGKCVRGLLCNGCNRDVALIENREQRIAVHAYLMRKATSWNRQGS